MADDTGQRSHFALKALEIVDIYRPVLSKQDELLHPETVKVADGVVEEITPLHADGFMTGGLTA